MKINEPITSEEHKLADEKHENLALKQKDYFHSLADRIEKGETLDQSDLRLAASLVRRASNAISITRKRPQGKPVLIREIVRVQYAQLTELDGLTPNQAIEALCEIHQTPKEPVSDTAIKKKLGFVGAGEKSKDAKRETDFFVRLFREGENRTPALETY